MGQVCRRPGDRENGIVDKEGFWEGLLWGGGADPLREIGFATPGRSPVIHNLLIVQPLLVTLLLLCFPVIS